jgi:hypothetical protein
MRLGACRQKDVNNAGWSGNVHEKKQESPKMRTLCQAISVKINVLHGI